MDFLPRAPLVGSGYSFLASGPLETITVLYFGPLCSIVITHLHADLNVGDAL